MRFVVLCLAATLCPGLAIAPSGAADRVLRVVLAGIRAAPLLVSVFAAGYHGQKHEACIHLRSGPEIGKNPADQRWVR